MEYSIVICIDTVSQFVTAINRLMREGWHPIGGPFMPDGSLAQAMIKGDA